MVFNDDLVVLNFVVLNGDLVMLNLVVLNGSLVVLNRDLVVLTGGSIEFTGMTYSKPCWVEHNPCAGHLY